MKKEIELKFIVKNLEPVREKLKQLGAHCIWSGRERNWFFDTREQTLKTRRDSALRIKLMGDATLTMKMGQRIERGVKVVHEYQTHIDNPEAVKVILKRLGLQLDFYYSKRREHWKFKNAYIELDILDSGEKFVEIESSQNGIRSLARKLKLDFAKSSTKSYTQILKKE